VCVTHMPISGHWSRHMDNACWVMWCWKHVDTIFLVIWCVCNVAQCLALVSFFLLLLLLLSLFFFVKVWRCRIIYFLYLIWSLFFFIIDFVFQFSPSSLVFIGSFVKLIYFSVSSFNIWFFRIGLHACFFQFLFCGVISILCSWS
jgi:hypothetical protein